MQISGASLRVTSAVLLALALGATACSSSNEDTSQLCVLDQDAPALAVEEADGLNGTVAITDVQLFDGTVVHDQTAVLFADGQIVAVGPNLTIPADAHRVDGSCHTLMPGLIDAHTHTIDEGALDRAVQFGVTTHLDMFTPPEALAFEQAVELSDPHRPRADLFSSGVLGTVAGGHGTQFGLPIPTLQGPGTADQWVQDRVDEGASFVKLVVEDFSLFGGRAPTLDQETLVAAVQAAEARDFLTITHVTKLDTAVLAVESGTDGLAHLFSDVVVDQAAIDLLLQEGTFIIATTVVLAAQESSFGSRTLVDDPNIGPRLTSDESRTLRRGPPGPRIPVSPALESLGTLHAAGVPLLAGSDAPNPGTLYGISMHRELEYFVEAGMTPVEALVSATSLSADTFGLNDRGRVASGHLADLVLVAGDPTLDITQTRAIVGVWKSGIPIELENQ